MNTSGNMTAIDLFRSHSRHSNNGRQHFQFPATVEYKFDGVTVTDVCKIQISLGTMELGNIEILEATRLNAKDFHMGFWANKEKYSHTAHNGANTLIIQGHSPKMYGNYVVVITEN